MPTLKVRKKPLEVEAIQWNGNLDEINNLIDLEYVKFSDEALKVWNRQEQDWINCPLGHYIIRGIKGEFYPCSPEVFKESYEII